MTKHSKAKAKAHQKKTPDAQLEEFEGRDLGDDIRRSKSARVLRAKRTRPTSVLLDEDLVAQLREKGRKRGLGYQTMLKMIVREHIDEY